MLKQFVISKIANRQMIAKISPVQNCRHGWSFVDTSQRIYWRSLKINLVSRGFLLILVIIRCTTFRVFDFPSFGVFPIYNNLIMDNQVTLEKIISLAKHRGFIFAGSEIYGGLANTYDFGPLGTELKRNILNHWWNTFVTSRQDMYGLDTSVLMSPKVWEASGHTASFTNIMIDCLDCNYRTRADHLSKMPSRLGNVEGNLFQS